MTEKELNEQKKEFLNRYKNAVRKYESLVEQEYALRQEIEGSKPIEYSDMPKGNRQTDLSDYMVRLDKVLTKIQTRKEEMQNIRLEIEEKITDLPDGIQSKVLYLRYISFKSWEDICVDLGYSWRQIHRIHAAALRNFKVA